MVESLKKYKMVVSDFDGTLVRSDDTISEHTKRVIAEFRRRGGVFTISTGRMHKAISPRLADVGLTGSFPLMSFQGALARDSESGKTLFSRALDTDLAIEFLREAEKLGLYCHYYSFDEIYVPAMNENNTLYCKTNRITPVVVGSVSQHLAKNRGEVAKALCIVDTHKIEAAYDKLSAKFGAKSQVLISAPVLIESISNEAGKGNGLKFAAQYYNIPLTETIAIGDEMNDVSMVIEAGLGVAVANASPRLKQVADIATSSNDQDGVATIIEKYCL